VRLPLSQLHLALAGRLAARRSVEFQPAEDPAGPPQLAAVAVILAPSPDSVLLIRRAEREGDPWSGHIGLPGGRHEPADTDLRVTAMRETVEEVGCTLSRDQLLGTLDDVWPRTPLQRVIVVRPFVFGVAERPVLSPNREVADAFWVPLGELRDPAIYRNSAFRIRGEDRLFPVYHLGPRDLVWGLTERILTSLLELTE
jgi:8-oxo-dGTP pyrophosphatase MutT (NUDIX family)